MTVSVQNSAVYQPVNMKVNKPSVGVIATPDRLYRPVLYSHIKATQEHKMIEHQLQEQIKKTKPPTKDTPKAVYVLLAAAGAILSFPLIKKLIKK